MALLASHFLPFINFVYFFPWACVVKFKMGIADLYTVSTSKKPLLNPICIFGANPTDGVLMGVFGKPVFSFYNFSILFHGTVQA